jgi:adenylylsulfate kinase
MPYKMARQGKIKNYTGVSAPYDEPISPDLVLETDKCSLDECVDQVVEFICDKSSKK